MRISRLLLLMILVLPLSVWAQKVISGKITDAQNNPLVGATVNVRSSNNSVQTDQNGNFSITVPNENAKLVISYVGYFSQTIDANKVNTSIQLQEDRTNLSEVVVTGL